MTPTVALLVLGKSREEAAVFPLAYVRDHVDELILMANPAGLFGGLGTIANTVLERSRCDVVGVVHADVSFCDGGFLGRLVKRAQQGALTGIVGRSITGDYVWCSKVQEPTAVSTLDGCSVFIPRARRPRLRFDAENFDSFHCCVEDLCLQGSAAGLEVLVVPGNAAHGAASWPAAPWIAAYGVYRQKLQEKWQHVPFLTT